MQNVNSSRSMNELSPIFTSLVKTSTPNLINNIKQTHHHKRHHDDSKDFYNIEKNLSILPIILMIAGTLGNTIAFYVLTRKKLRIQSTMLYFASLTIMDTISLYQWNFNFFYKYQLNSQNQNLENQSLFLCRYISFMAHFSMQTSAWILAIISVDRYLIVTNTNWKQKFSKNIRFSLTVIISVILLVACVNLPVALFNGRVNTSFNNTSHYYYLAVESQRKVDCYNTRFIRFWQKFSLILECIFPLILMILFNGLLINRTYESSIKLSIQQQQQQQLHQHHHKSKSNKLLKSVSMTSNIIALRNNNSNKIANSCYDLGNMEKVGSSYSSLAATNENSKTSNKMSSLILKKENSTSSFKSTQLNDSRSTQNSRSKSFKKSSLESKNSNNNNTNNENNNNNNNLDESSLLSPAKKLTVIQQSSYSLSIIPYICHEEDDSSVSKLNKAIAMKENSESNFKIKRISIKCEHSLKNTKLDMNNKSLNTTNTIFSEPATNTYLSASNAFSLSSCTNNSNYNSNNNNNNKNTNNNNDSNHHHHNHHHHHHNHNSNSIGLNFRRNSGVIVDPVKSLASLSERKISNLRNRRIVLMLSLLTLSFTLSTLPSSIFYTFFRPLLTDKPYRRLLTMSFTLLRHLSHAFNFIIYFTSSSIIKQQLKEIVRELKKKNILRYMNHWCCCFIYLLPNSYNRSKPKRKSNKSLDVNNAGDIPLEEDTSTNLQISYYKKGNNNNNNNQTKFNLENNLDENSSLSPRSNLAYMKNNPFQNSQTSLNLSITNNNNKNEGQENKSNDFDDLNNPELTINSIQENNNNNNNNDNNNNKTQFETITFNVPNLKTNSNSNFNLKKKKRRWF